MLDGFYTACDASVGSEKAFFPSLSCSFFLVPFCSSYSIVRSSIYIKQHGINRRKRESSGGLRLVSRNGMC
jgi:hypothetical protein